MQKIGFIDPFWAVKIFEFAIALEKAKTLDSTIKLFDREVRDLGFHSYLITTLDQREFSRRVVARSWHPGWVAMYAEKNLNESDPIRRKLTARPQHPFLWSEAAHEFRRIKNAQRVMNCATDFKMNKGYCIPVYRDGIPTASVSISGEKPDLGPGVKSSLHVMSLFTFNRMSILTQSEKGQPLKYRRLTQREREVLLWVLAGKSDRDIAEILNISERTALAHVINASHKLNAPNRTATVVEALRVGELSIN